MNAIAPKRRARTRDESGNALVLTLVFTVLFVVLVASVAGYSYSAGKTATVAGDRRTDIDRANAAMELAVAAVSENVRTNGFAIGGVPGCGLPAAFDVPGGPGVVVDCRVVSKSSNPPATDGNKPDNAILALNTGGKSIHNPGNGASFVVQGTIKSAGTIELMNGNREGRALKVIDGDVLAKCDPGTGWDKVLLISAGRTACPATSPTVTLADAIAPFPLPAGLDLGTMPDGVVPPACSAANRVATFNPGYYGSDKLDAMNARFEDTIAATKCEVFHFPAGVYLFAWGNRELKLQGKVIAGTLTNALTPASNPNPPFPGACNRWTGTGNPADSQGALFLFAGTAQMGVHTGQAEFCPYHLNPADPNNSQHVSFRTITALDPAAASSVVDRRLAGGALMTASGFTNAVGVNGPTAADLNAASASLTGNSIASLRAPLAIPIPTAAGLNGVTVDVRWKWTGAKPEYLRVRLVDAAGNNVSCGQNEATSGNLTSAGIGYSTASIATSNCWWKNDQGAYIKQQDVQLRVEVKANGTATVDIDDVVVKVNGALFGAWSPPAANNRFVFDNKDDTQISVWGTVVAPEAELNLKGQAFKCSRRGYLRGVVADRVVFYGGASYQQEVGIGTPSTKGEAKATVVLQAKINGHPLVAVKVRFRATDTAGVRVSDQPTTEYWLIDESVNDLPDPDDLDPEEESCQ